MTVSVEEYIDDWDNDCTALMTEMTAVLITVGVNTDDCTDDCTDYVDDWDDDRMDDYVGVEDYVGCNCVDDHW